MNQYRLIFMLVGFLLWVESPFAQAQYQASKEVLYTLQAGERIANSENALSVYQSKLGYMVVVENKASNKRKYLVNKNIYADFDRESIEIPQMNDYHWGFVESKGDSNWVVFDGRIERYPSFKHTVDLSLTKNLRAYLVYDETLSEYRLMVNERERGSYANLLKYYLSPEGDSWAVSYFINVGTHYEYYVKLSSGQRLGPFARIIDFALLNEDRWVLLAEKADMQKRTIQGQEIETFQVITHRGDLGVFEKELVGKPYEAQPKLTYTNLNFGMNVIKDQKIYYMVNGEMFGPYEDFVVQSDLGIKPNRFNYVVGKEQVLYFRGEKSFARNVRKFTVSDSRNSVAIIKSVSANSDTLNINDKYFVGVFKRIMDINFVPNTENFYFWVANSDGTYQLQAYISNQLYDFKKYAVKPLAGGRFPKVVFSPSFSHWAFVYQSTANAQQKIVIDGQEFDSGFINDVVLYAERGQEHASWLSLEGGKDIVLNKVSF
jgi:hypothetical protein